MQRECNTGLECDECEKHGGCETHLEARCISCGKRIPPEENGCDLCAICEQDRELAQWVREGMDDF